ncbi:hypothetical protein BU15DRAFT_79913 [Melanogaster broomeanus]|nr:hypothetical protein BU15DRAFT_79913 [Melanogaster broomeanus]
MKGDVLRRSARTNSSLSGSEYRESERSMMDEDPPASEPEDEPKEELVWAHSTRGRKVKKNNYMEPPTDDDLPDGQAGPVNGKKAEPETDDDDDAPPRRLIRSRKPTSKRNNLNGFIASDDDNNANDNQMPRYGLRTRSKPGPPTTSSGRITRQPKRFTPGVNPSKRVRDQKMQKGSLEDAPRTSSDIEADIDAEGEPDIDGEGEPDLDVQDDGRPYALRERAKINYAIPPPLEEVKPAPKSRPGGRGGAREKI